jgi:hypothetical protein
MSAQEEARAARAELTALTVDPNLPSRVVEAIVRAGNALAAGLLGDPVPADESEALVEAARVEALRINEWAEDRFPADESAHGVDEDSFMAGAAFAAGFRRQWPITDAQVEAAREAVARVMTNAGYDPARNIVGALAPGIIARVALEAARDA